MPAQAANCLPLPFGLTSFGTANKGPAGCDVHYRLPTEWKTVEAHHMTIRQDEEGLFFVDISRNGSLSLNNWRPVSNKPTPLGAGDVIALDHERNIRYLVEEIDPDVAREIHPKCTHNSPAGDTLSGGPQPGALVGSASQQNPEEPPQQPATAKPSASKKGASMPKVTMSTVDDGAALRQDSQELYGRSSESKAFQRLHGHVKAMRKECEERTFERDALAEEVIENNKEIERLGALVQNGNAKVAELRGEVAAHRDELLLRQTVFEAQRKSFEETQSRLKTFQTEMSWLRQENQNCVCKLHEREMEIKSLRQQKDQLEEERNTIRLTIAQLFSAVTGAGSEQKPPRSSNSDDADKDQDTTPDSLMARRARSPRPSLESHRVFHASLNRNETAFEDLLSKRPSHGNKSNDTEFALAHNRSSHTAASPCADLSHQRSLAEGGGSFEGPFNTLTEQSLLSKVLLAHMQDSNRAGAHASDGLGAWGSQQWMGVGARDPDPCTLLTNALLNAACSNSEEKRERAISQLLQTSSGFGPPLHTLSNVDTTCGMAELSDKRRRMNSTGVDGIAGLDAGNNNNTRVEAAVKRSFLTQAQLCHTDDGCTADGVPQGVNMPAALTGEQSARLGRAGRGARGKERADDLARRESDLSSDSFTAKLSAGGRSNKRKEAEPDVVTAPQELKKPLKRIRTKVPVVPVLPEQDKLQLLADLAAAESAGTPVTLPDEAFATAPMPAPDLLPKVGERREKSAHGRRINDRKGIAMHIMATYALKNLPNHEGNLTDMAKLIEKVPEFHKHLDLTPRPGTKTYPRWKDALVGCFKPGRYPHLRKTDKKKESLTVYTLVEGQIPEKSLPDKSLGLPDLMATGTPLATQASGVGTSAQPSDDAAAAAAADASTVATLQPQPGTEQP